MFEAVDLLVDRVGHLFRQTELGDLGAVLPDDVVVTLAEFPADRRQLLAKEVLPLLLVDSFGDVGADLRGDLQLGEMVLGPSGDQIDTIAEIDCGEHGGLVVGVRFAPRRDGIGQLARIDDAAQDLRQPAAAAQLGDLLEHHAQLARRGLDSRCRARSRRAASTST